VTRRATPTSGFDSETGLLLVDMNHADEMRVAAVYLDVNAAVVLASQLKTFLLRKADTPSDERTIVLLKRGVHP